jgi:isopropylmalate/homocitrate/citramalate synthase
VKIGKAAEDFILKNAERCNIKLSEYNLSDNLEELKKITKQINSLRNKDLKQLFFDIKQNKNSDFCKLAQWIENFKNNPYNFDNQI